MFSDQTKDIGINGIIKKFRDKINISQIYNNSFNIKWHCEITNILNQMMYFGQLMLLSKWVLRSNEENKKIIVNGKRLESLQQPKNELHI